MIVYYICGSRNSASDGWHACKVNGWGFIAMRVGQLNRVGHLDYLYKYLSRGA